MTILPYGIKPYKSASLSLVPTHGIQEVSTVCHLLITQPHFFRFLQVRHAMQTNFSSEFTQSVHNPLMEVVESTELHTFISIFYGMLLLPSSSQIAYRIKTKWENDMGNIEDEQ